jgi:hypothetical protein
VERTSLGMNQVGNENDSTHESSKSQKVYPADLQAHGLVDAMWSNSIGHIMIDKRRYSQCFHVLKTDSTYRYRII